MDFFEWEWPEVLDEKNVLDSFKVLDSGLCVLKWRLRHEET